MEQPWPQRSRITLALLLVTTSFAALAAAQDSANRITIFNSDPDHPWNRTYTCLLVRQDVKGLPYGIDALDPPLWSETRHLLTGDSHRQALDCLDRLLSNRAGDQPHDPLKAAIFQRDLWSVFDWAAMGVNWRQERRELEQRLALAIKRVALSPEQITSLPDNYAEAIAANRYARAYDPRNPSKPFLPPDLFRTDGPWVYISAYSTEPTAIVHISGRSRFLVFIKLPGDRKTTLAYLAKLRSEPRPPLLPEGAITVLNLELPQLPVGTQVALVRQLIVIDNAGRLVATRLTESVQFRVYHAVTPGSKYVNYINGPSRADQDFFEFRISRPEVFANHRGGLIPVEPGQIEFATFMTHGSDAFESKNASEVTGPVLERCHGCHSDSGIHSVQSRLQWMKPSSRAGAEAAKTGVEDPIAWETQVTVARKYEQPEFRLLRRMWQGGRH